MNKCASLIGFRFRHFERHFAEYLGELVELYRTGQLTVQIDIGGGDVPFFGVAAVVDAVEVRMECANSTDPNTISIFSLTLAASTVGEEHRQGGGAHSTVVVSGQGIAIATDLPK